MAEHTADIDALLRQAADALALPAGDLAAQRHGLHALLCRLASVYDRCAAGEEASKLENTLRDLGAALDRAAVRDDAVPRSFRTRARLARRTANATPPPDHPPARELHEAHEMATSSLGRALRSTATGLLVERVDRLVESAERILALPVMAARPLPDERDLARQFEMQLSALKRIRNALAVAHLDAEKLRASLRPLSFLLVGSLDLAEGVLIELERALPIFEGWAEGSTHAVPAAPPSGPRPRKAR